MVNPAGAKLLISPKGAGYNPDRLISALEHVVNNYDQQINLCHE